MNRNVAAQVASVLVLVFLAWKANGNGYGYPSRCGDGDVITIKYPFRLQGDPPKRGGPRYELTCDANRTILVLDSKIYHVKAISYQNKTIRIVEPGLSHGDCSLPRYHLLNPLDWAEVTSNSYFRIGRRILAVLKCQDSVDDSSYVDATPCINVSDSFSSQGYTYVLVKDGWSNPDMRDSCNLIAMVPTELQEIDNRSIVDIHMELMMGFEISWEESSCSDCDEKVSTCTDPCYFVDPPGNNISLIVLLGCVLTGARIFYGTMFILVVLFYKFEGRRSAFDNGIEAFLRNYKSITPKRYSYSDIKKITKGFEEKLGEGGFGSVFKGKLKNGHLVTVKMLAKSKGNGQDFINEVATIGRIHHVNVVQLIGFCSDRSKRALIYEFMPNGSLDKYVFPQEGKSNPLSWEIMYKIALGVAQGIGYLHRGCAMKILHFDIKPHNILLDKNFIPKISDFGLAKFYPMDISVVSVTAARGTFGYMSPELFYGNVGGVSYKSDVYSFGMLLMEMAGRRKNLDAMAVNSSQIYFPSWIYDRISRGGELEMGSVMDHEKEMVKKLAIVALWCIQMKPIDRPSMSRVVEMLEGSVHLLQMPPKPFQSSTQQM